MKDGVLVFIEQRDGKPERAAWEALAGGQTLAADLGCGVSSVVVGKSASAAAGEVVASAKVSQVYVAEADALNAYTPEGYAAALKEVIGAVEPAWVVFSHTYQVRDFAPKLAAELSSTLAGDCIGYRVEGGKAILVRQVFQGKYACDVEVEGSPRLVSFQAGVFREDAVEKQEAKAPVETVQVQLAADQIRSRPEEPFREAKQAIDLTQAEMIVAVGRGIKGPEAMDAVKKLAEALGAEIAASRPVCDSGWLPMDRQVGSSGQTVAPKLYLALGISGAIQHQVGMKGSKTIVAVNKDAEAPIFEIASYGIVGDLFEVMPPLTEELEKLKSSG